MGGYIFKKGTRKWRQEEKKKARLQAWHEKKGLRSTQKQGHVHTHGLHGPHQQQGAVVGAPGGGLAAVGRAGLASLQQQQQQQKQQLGEEEEEAEAEEGGVEGVLVGTIQGALGGGRGGGDKGFRGVRRVPGIGGARRFGFKKAVRYARKAVRRVHAGKKGQGKGQGGKGKLVHLV